MRKVNLCCQYSLCLYLRFFLNNNSRVNLPWPQFMPLPPQMMSRCYRAAKKLNFTWLLLDKAMGTTEARQRFACWLKKFHLSTEFSCLLSCYIFKILNKKTRRKYKFPTCIANNVKMFVIFLYSAFWSINWAEVRHNSKRTILWPFPLVSLFTPPLFSLTFLLQSGLAHSHSLPITEGCW